MGRREHCVSANLPRVGDNKTRLYYICPKTACEPTYQSLLQ